MSTLPPRQEIPATPAIEAPCIQALYDIYETEEKGRGAFSRVVCGRHKATGEMRAVKIMDRAHLVGKKPEMVAHEKEILRRTIHPSIIRLHECIQTPEKVYMVMDLMHGDLFEYIVSHRRLSEVDSAKIMRQLMSAIEYLHQNSVVHRDVKPENILINSPDDIKLADFGLAKVVQEWDVKSTPCGTSFYIAPEIIRGIEANGAKPLCTTRHEVKCVDLWSCGVVLFVCLAGRPPFTGQVKTTNERRALLAKIDRGVLFPDAQWATISENAKDLVLRLLTQDSSMRITASDALRHPFFSVLGAAAPPPVAAPPESPTTEAPNPVALREEVNAMQGDQVAKEDVEGDTSSYRPPVTIQESRPEPKRMVNFADRGRGRGRGAQ